jgi:hypothetical protein
MKTAQVLSIKLLAPAILSGCMVRTSLRITNRTRQEIYVRSGHTGQVTRIKAAVPPPSRTP